MGCYLTKLDDRVSARFKPEEVIREDVEVWMKHDTSSCCNIEGKGVLVLTHDKLWFSLLCPSIETTVPFSTLAKVKATDRYLNERAFISGLSLLVIDHLVQGMEGEEKHQLVFTVREGTNERWVRDIVEAVDNWRHGTKGSQKKHIRWK